jgi:hypothetical protein
MCFERLGVGGIMRIFSEDSLPLMGPYVETVAFFRQGTCWCYKEFTHYHPINFYISVCVHWQSWSVIGGGAVSGDGRLPSRREQEPLGRGGATVLEVCLIKSTWPIWTVGQKLRKPVDRVVLGGYAELNGEHQGDLGDITSSDSVVCTGCLACQFKIVSSSLLLFVQQNSNSMSGGNVIFHCKWRLYKVIFVTVIGRKEENSLNIGLCCWEMSGLLNNISYEQKFHLCRNCLWILWHFALKNLFWYVSGNGWFWT